MTIAKIPSARKKARNVLVRQPGVSAACARGLHYACGKNNCTCPCPHGTDGDGRALLECRGTCRDVTEHVHGRCAGCGAGRAASTRSLSCGETESLKR